MPPNTRGNHLAVYNAESRGSVTQTPGERAYEALGRKCLRGIDERAFHPEAIGGANKAATDVRLSLEADDDQLRVSHLRTSREPTYSVHNRSKSSATSAESRTWNSVWVSRTL